ncbi:DUF3726 domain-containing protein [Psychrobacter lutiphocae]|uniref:DUF3726 domain-containing protein n=1 Tax=Psychrobacter lutiphocae TaxID=540500 RepID=UPI00035E5952|nr:DUF3726 domain-containing protein [Psychrobacter lutiphocae]
MIVSHNEIITLVQKAFLGMHRECGEADLIANMVAELQMAGLDGIRQFNKASDFLFSEQEVAIEIVGDKIIDDVVVDEVAHPVVAETKKLEFDFHGNSLVYHLPAIIDYALEQLTDSEHLVLELKKCRNRWLAYGELVKLAPKGIACMARWDNGSDPKHTLFILNLGSIYPDLYFYNNQASKNADSIQNMTIELAYHNFEINDYDNQYAQLVSADDILASHQQSWDKGIEVDEQEWQKLKETARHMLVKNSEASMRGAGGA